MVRLTCLLIHSRDLFMSSASYELDPSNVFVATVRPFKRQTLHTKRKNLAVYSVRRNLLTIFYISSFTSFKDNFSATQIM
jgi:hypothetical protein